jgi:hypothetical protein
VGEEQRGGTAWAALSILTLVAFAACEGGAPGEGSLVKGGESSECTLDTCVQRFCADESQSCDDHDSCTVDSCDPVAGCLHATVPVDDGDACTADACDPVFGVSHASVSCDDGDACTADSCDVALGCVHAPIAGVDDDNACTKDSCDPMTGKVTHAPIPDCCPHSACLTGVPLNLACSYPGPHNNCVKKVCDVDPFCCLGGWDSLCVAHTRDPNICPTGILPGFFSCVKSHSYCAVGAPLAKGSDPCVKKVCDVDPSCCLGAWDALCVSEVHGLCDVPSGADCK